MTTRKSKPRAPDLVACLRSVLRWAQFSKQPARAIVCHHGITSGPIAAGGLKVTLQLAWGPGGAPTLIVKPVEQYREGADGERVEMPLPDEAWKAVQTALGKLSVAVADKWNGPPCSSGSLRLGVDWSAGLKRTQVNYNKLRRPGCLDKGFAGFCSCCTRYRAKCYKMARIPVGWL